MRTGSWAAHQPRSHLERERNKGMKSPTFHECKPMGVTGEQELEKLPVAEREFTMGCKRRTSRDMEPLLRSNLSER